MKESPKNSEEKIVKTFCFSCRGGCGVFLHIKKNDGAEAIVQGIGTGRNQNDWSARFCNHLGTPNANDPMHFCMGPRCVAGYYTFGIPAPLDPHYTATNCLV